MTDFFFLNSTPTNDPGETERSSVLPVGDFQDYAFAVKKLNQVKGPVTDAIQGTSQAHTDHDDEFFTSFSSDALAAQTIDANTWTIAVSVRQQNANANSFIICSLYVFREPSTVVGFIYDSDTALGAEWSNGYSGRVATFSGSALTILLNDYLVLEFWRHTAGQGMSMGYDQGLQYSGTIDIVENGAGSASRVTTPQTITYPGGVTLRTLATLGVGQMVMPRGGILPMPKGVPMTYKNRRKFLHSLVLRKVA